jgi:hypothetical protein
LIVIYRFLFLSQLIFSPSPAVVFAVALQIRRRAVAALGELLFYVATSPPAATPQDAPGSGFSLNAQNVWQIPLHVIRAFARCIRAEEDNIVRLYAAKAIENVSDEFASVT